MKCPYCNHDDFTHLLDGEGPCQAWLIKSETKPHEIDFIPGDDMEAATWAIVQEIEYDIQCPCHGRSLLNQGQRHINIKVRRRGSQHDSSSNITMDSFIH